MKFCTKCGKEIIDGTKSCSNCDGLVRSIDANAESPVIYDAATSEETIEQASKQQVSIYNGQRNNKRHKLTLIVIIATVIAISIAIAAVLLFSNTDSRLNDDEMLAYECALEMKSMMKDPDSFRLYDSMYMLQIYDKEGELLVTYTMFKYGGTNSYGAVVTDEAVFKDGKY